MTKTDKTIALTLQPTEYDQLRTALGGEDE